MLMHEIRIILRIQTGNGYVGIFDGCIFIGSVKRMICLSLSVGRQISCLVLSVMYIPVLLYTSVCQRFNTCLD